MDAHDIPVVKNTRGHFVHPQILYHDNGREVLSLGILRI